MLTGGSKVPHLSGQGLLEPWGGMGWDGVEDRLLPLHRAMGILTPSP